MASQNNVIVDNLPTVIKMAAKIRTHQNDGIVAMYKEKVSLRDKSQKRISSWTNTIKGARKSKLAAHEVKLKLGEAHNS
jgi:hypothetical protein